MSWIIVKRAAKFVDATIEENPRTKELVQNIKSECVVYPNAANNPQEVPDWAENDDLYKLGVEEGWLVEVTEQSAKAQIKRNEEQAAKEVTEKKPAGLQHPQQPHQAGWKR